MCSTRINMLLDITRVQCSASGGLLLTVAASHILSVTFLFVVLSSVRVTLH